MNKLELKFRAEFFYRPPIEDAVKSFRTVKINYSLPIAP